MNHKTHQIAAIIEEMVATTGQVPSYKAIHDKLGSGSNATIKKALGAYHQKHAPANTLSSAPDLPEKLLNRVGKIANDIWLGSQAQAQAEWAEERNALTQQLRILQKKYEALRDKDELQEVLADHICHHAPTSAATEAYVQLTAQFQAKTELLHKAAIALKKSLMDAQQLRAELALAKAKLADATRAPEATSV